MPTDLSPGLVLFVGGFVAALFLFAAALTYVAAGGDDAVTGLAVTLAAGGVVALVVGAGVAVVVRVLDG